MTQLIGDEAKKAVEGLGFDRIEHIHGSTYKDNSTVIVVPTRGIEKHTEDVHCKSGNHKWCMIPAFHQKVMSAWQSLITPMNQKRAFLYTTGHEVGQAYNAMIEGILANPELAKWKYILTLEDDNVVPADAHIRLLESIEQTGYDAMSGIYFTKGDIGMPMAYGDPDEYRKTGVLDFRPRDIRGALQNGNVMEVNGIAMGCALWRISLFKEIPKPWFVTVADLIPDKGVQCFTQDLNFCEKGKKSGKRFGVDFRVKVGHLDVNSGVVY
jgi:hypothetical protein